MCSALLHYRGVVLEQNRSLLPAMSFAPGKITLDHAAKYPAPTAHGVRGFSTKRLPAESRRVGLRLEVAMRLKPAETLRVWHLGTAIALGFHLQTQSHVPLFKPASLRTDAGSRPPE